MNEPRHPDEPAVHRAMQHRLTRRSVMKGAGMGVAGFSVASFLAACGGGGDSGASQNPQDVFSGQPGDKVVFENWPLYIDQAKDKDGNVYHPSLEAFTKETGITVDYDDGILSNEEFFGKIQPQLEAGDSTGYDIIVITNGRQFNLLVGRGWVYELDTTKRPNFDENAVPFAADPDYDPGAK